jgi:4-hydroxy-tetrahydrodipicolinate synthase
VEIAVETVRRLAAASPRFAGIKESGGNPERVTQLRAALGRRFSILCGDDALTVPFMALGAHGVVSVASNIVPRPVAQIVQACARGHFAAALKLHDQYHPLFRDLFIESNPGPVKAALAMMGRIAEEYRLPLAPLAEKNRQALQATLQKFHLLKS